MVTFLFSPEIFIISTASSIVNPPITLGAETPGKNALFIESTSNETKIY